MFTGIIEELGEVLKIQHSGRNTSLVIKADKVSFDCKIGDSIALNGVCLTVVKIQNNLLSFDLMPQTLKASNLGELIIKDKVNLERSLKVGDRVSGHFVYGHVDCIGIIRNKTFLQENQCFEIAIAHEFISKITMRGSIAVDGISLTIQKKSGNSFSVYIIPHTFKNTIFNFKGHSDKVNIEFDKLINRDVS